MVAGEGREGEDGASHIPEAVAMFPGHFTACRGVSNEFRGIGPQVSVPRTAYCSYLKTSVFRGESATFGKKKCMFKSFQLQPCLSTVYLIIINSLCLLSFHV